MDFNEILFYGGIAAMVITIVTALIFYVIFLIGKIDLDHKFDHEYGELTNNKKKGGR